MKGGSFGAIQRSQSAEKSPKVKNTKIAKWGILSMFYVFEVLDVGFVSFCFGRGSEVRVFETSVVQVVDKMNKKVDLTRLKKLPTVRVGHFSLKAPTKNEWTDHS